MAVEIVDRGLRLTRVTAIPAQELPHMRPILLLGVRVVVLLVGAPAGEGDLPPAAVLQQERVDEFRAVVRVEPAQREGQAALSSSRAARTVRWDLPHSALDSTQPVRMSVRFSDWRPSPSAQLPERETKSTSVKPGVVRSQWSVRMGM